MKSCRRLLFPLLALACAASATLAAEKTSAPPSAATTDAIRAALAAADDERCAASIAGDGPRLDAIFSDALYYAHSNGKIDTKETYMAGLVARRSRYRFFDYRQRTFDVVAPGLALMTGRVLIGLGSPEKPSTNEVVFLAVWREEAGRWRFRGWQATKLAPPAEPGAK